MLAINALSAQFIDPSMVVFPTWTPTNNQLNNIWADFQSALVAVMMASPAGTSSLSIVGQGLFPQTLAPNIPILMLDGRVFLIPTFAPLQGVIFNPKNNVIATSSNSFPSSLIGGVLLQDGRVFCVGSGVACQIYNPITNTITAANCTPPSASGGVLLPDGRVYIVPSNTTSARIYNPATDTTIIPVGTFPTTSGGAAFCGGVLYQNNENWSLDPLIFCVPSTSSTARIYSVNTNTLSTPPGTYAGTTGAYFGGVLMSDGSIYISPSNGLSGKKYNPSTNVLSNFGSFSAAYNYNAGITMPDGNLFFPPSNVTNGAILNYSTGAVTYTSQTFSGAGTGLRYWGGCLLQDGRIFCSPRRNENAAIYNPNIATNNALDIQFVTSPFYNNSH